MRRVPENGLGGLSATIRSISARIVRLLLSHDTTTSGTDRTPDPRIQGVSFLSPHPTEQDSRGRLLLAPGVGCDAASIAALQEALTPLGAVAVLVQCAHSPEEAATAHDTPADAVAGSGTAPRTATGAVPVFGLPSGDDWGYIAAAAHAQLRPEAVDYVASARTGDLFGAANSLASIAGGAVSFVDTSGQITAYSTHKDQPIDEVRRASTLSLREIGPISADSDHREVARSAGAMFLAGLPGQYDRVACAVRYGGELLGSVWVVQVDPAGAPATVELLDAVIPALSQHFLRARNDAIGGAQHRRAQVLAILENSNDAHTAYAQLGLPPRQEKTVVTFGVHDQSSTYTKYGLTRLLHLVVGNASTAFAFSECVLLGNRVVAVIAGSSDEHIRSFAQNVCRADATIAAGIGTRVSTEAALPQSYREAELTVSALLAAGGDGPGPHAQLSTFREARDTIALHHIAASLNDLPFSSGDAYSEILAHDSAHGTELTPTLRTFLDLGGNVREAATALHIHQNTLRYRIATITDTLGIALDDPATRLWLWLRLTSAALTEGPAISR